MGLGLTCDWDSKWGVNSPQEHLCTYYISAVKDREKSRAQTKLLFLAIWPTMVHFNEFRSEMLKFPLVIQAIQYFNCNLSFVDTR